MMEMRNETIDMIKELGLTVDDLMKMTKYTREHLERYMNLKKYLIKQSVKFGIS